MSKRGRIIAAITAIIVVAGIAAGILIAGQGGGPEIETATVSEQELAVTVTASGKIETGVQADVYPPTQGTLEQVFVSDGETVTAGERIAEMDTTQLELQVAQARAALAQARAQHAAIHQQESGPADFSAAQANVDATYRAYLAAKQQAASIPDQAPSQAQIDAAEAATDAAAQAYNNALDAYQAYPSNDATRAALGLAADQAYVGYLNARAGEEQIKSTDLRAAQAQADAGVSQAFAAYKGAQAQYAKLQNADTSAQHAAADQGIRQAATTLSIAEQNLEDATLVAPIDGVVIYNSPGAAAAAAAGGAAGGAAGAATGAAGAATGAAGADAAAAAGASAGAAAGTSLIKGSPVSPASAPFSVVDLDALKFTAEVDEADIDRVKVGMNANVTLDAFPGEEFATRVVRVNPVAQPTATGGTVFEVELVLNDTAQDVLIGMKGDAIIEVSSEPSALTIPVEALFSEGGTDYVYVVENGKLEKTEITVGATTDTEVEVLSGLEKGDVVALSGATQYTDGMAVSVAGD